MIVGKWYEEVFFSKFVTTGSISYEIYLKK